MKISTIIATTATALLLAAAPGACGKSSDNGSGNNPPPVIPSQYVPAPTIHHVHFTVRAFDEKGMQTRYVTFHGFVSATGVNGQEAKYDPTPGAAGPVEDRMVKGPRPIINQAAPWDWEMDFNADIVAGRIYATTDVPIGYKLTCDVTEEAPGGLALVHSFDSIDSPGLGASGKTQASTVECFWPYP